MRKLAAVLVAIAMVAIGCGESSDLGTGDARVQELEAELERVRSEKERVVAELEGLGTALSEGSALEPVIVDRPAEIVETSETLKDVLDRGTVRCGGNANAPGFGYLDQETNRFVGFDVDFCRAIAAALFGPVSADQVEIRPLSSTVRFAPLQDGSVDVLLRNTTWTSTRDTALAVEFVAVTFYDGQGLLVRVDSGIERFGDLSGRSVCVGEGSTSADNIAAYVDQRGIQADIVVISGGEDGRNEYERGICDAFSSDQSGLAGDLALFDSPEDHVVIDQTISREPLGPAVRHGDHAWGDVVRWVVQCTINAEFLGVTQKNVDSMLESEDLNVQRLLGTAGEVGASIGLPADFCYQVVSQVGNYADIYIRHLGPLSPVSIPRGLNDLFTSEDGILYPLPFK